MRGRKKNFGIIGISTLFILIAIIIISVAAGVILAQTSSRLQVAGLRKQYEAERRTINGVEIVSILGEDGSAGRDIERFEIVVRLAPGSGDLGLINNTIVSFKSRYDFAQYIFNSSAGNTNTFPPTTEVYHVEWIKTSSAYEMGYIKRGDLIKIRFNHPDVDGTATTGGLAPGEKIEIDIAPQYGYVTRMSLIMPHRIHQKREGLYPDESSR